MIVHKIVCVATNSTTIHSSVVATNSTCVTHEVLVGAVSEQLVLYHTTIYERSRKKSEICLFVSVSNERQSSRDSPLLQEVGGTVSR